jgi:hypothetical protein
LTQLTTLWLCFTNVYGDPAAITSSIPGLASWGGHAYDFTRCSSYGSCPAGLAPSAGTRR